MYTCITKASMTYFAHAIHRCDHFCPRKGYLEKKCVCELFHPAINWFWERIEGLHLTMSILPKYPRLRNIFNKETYSLVFRSELLHKKLTITEFVFKVRVYWNLTFQEEVYKSCVEALVRSIFEGYNATVFAYGQTVRP